MKYQDFLASLDFGSAVALLAVVVITLAGLTLGLVILDVLKLKFRHPAYRLGAACAPGFAVIALLSLVMGTFCGYYSWLIWIIFTGIAIAGTIRYSRVISGAISASYRYNSLGMIMLAAAMIYFMGSAFLFPGSWDEATYQVTLSLRWSQCGSAAVFPDLPYSGFPAAPQLIDTMLISIGGILTARLMQWMIYLLLFWFLIILVRKCGKLSSLALSACFILAPVNLAMIKDVYSEPWMLMTLVSGIMLIKGNRDKGLAKYIVLGVCSGFVLAVKLTGAAIALVLLIISSKISSSERKAFVLSTLTFGGIAGVYALLFYLRPWILTGNPLYPYFGWIFGNAADAQTAYYHHAMGSYKFGLKNFYGFFTLPIFVAFKGGSMFDGIIFGAQFIVLFCLSIIAAVRIWRQRNGIGIRLVTAAIVFYLFWFFTSQQSRFLTPLYILLILIAGDFIRSLPERKLKDLAGLVLIVAVACGLWQDYHSLFHYKTAWKIIFSGREKMRPRYLAVIMREYGYIQSMDALNRLPENAKVMLIFERRGLYVPRKYVIGTPYFQSCFFTPIPENEDDVLKVLQKNKIFYVLMGPSLHNPDHLKEYNDLNFAFSRLFARLLKAKKIRYLWGSKDGYNLLLIPPATAAGSK